MTRILAFASILLLSIPAAHAERIADLLQIEHPYAYATTSVQKNGAVFMTFLNFSVRDEVLTKAESDIAERVELHTHIMDGDVMMMREVEGFEIPKKGELMLEPTGHHIMLFGLKEALKPDSTFPMVLHFADGNTREVTVKVVKPGETP